MSEFDVTVAERRKNYREEKLKEIYKFIGRATTEEMGYIIAEILCCHDNLVVWNRKTKHLDEVDSVSLNGGCIQLNVEVEEQCDSSNQT